jgi:hypothetical protein
MLEDGKDGWAGNRGESNGSRCLGAALGEGLTLVAGEALGIGSKCGFELSLGVQKVKISEIVVAGSSAVCPVMETALRTLAEMMGVL